MRVFICEGWKIPTFSTPVQVIKSIYWSCNHKALALLHKCNPTYVLAVFTALPYGGGGGHNIDLQKTWSKKGGEIQILENLLTFWHENLKMAKQSFLAAGGKAVQKMGNIPNLKLFPQWNPKSHQRKNPKQIINIINKKTSPLPQLSFCTGTSRNSMQYPPCCQCRTCTAPWRWPAACRTGRRCSGSSQSAAGGPSSCSRTSSGLRR